MEKRINSKTRVFTPIKYDKIYDNPKNIKNRIHIAVKQKFPPLIYNDIDNNVNRINRLNEHQWRFIHSKKEIFHLPNKYNRNIMLLFKALDIYNSNKIYIDPFYELFEFFKYPV